MVVVKVSKKVYLGMFKIIVVLIFAGSTAVFSSGVMREISSMDIVKEMCVGWNLGNTLDAWSDKVTGLKTETCWGVPKTTKEMFDTVKSKGFKTIRIPVTWRGHFGDAPDFLIDKEWLDRVEEVVNYALDGKTYVIINSHHDEWVTLTAETKTEVKDKICKIWVQIAERFKEYDDHLVFETLNEPRLYGTQYEWTGGTPEARSILNELNDAIVKAIRSTGGNNPMRHIMIPTYCASTVEEAQKGLVIPPGESRIIVSQHLYFPYYFTMDVSPSTSTDKWGSEKDKKNLTAEFERIYDIFIKKGMPVVIGEWGSINKSNEDARIAHAKYFMEEAYKRGICAIWWDNNLPRPGEQTFGLLDRSTCKWSHPQIVDAIMEGIGGSEIKVNSSRPHLCGYKRFVPLINIAASGSVLSRQPILFIYDLNGRVVFKNSFLSKAADYGTLHFSRTASRYFLIQSANELFDK